MLPLVYRATIPEDAPDGFVVSFASIPEALTGGSTLAEAYANAHDALAVAIDGYLAKSLPIPAADNATADDGPLEPLVAVGPAVAARVLLQSEMAAHNITQSGLARMLNKDEKSVRRILGGANASFELTLKALAALGVRPALAV